MCFSTVLLSVGTKHKIIQNYTRSRKNPSSFSFASKKKFSMKFFFYCENFLL
jgi:hypothetical protein